MGAANVWLIIGIPIGIMSAVRRRTALNRVAVGGALLFISVPMYWLGLVSLYVLSNDIGVVHIFDGAGSDTGLTADPVGWFNSLLLPSFVLAVSFAAVYSRLLRSSLIETISEDYIPPPVPRDSQNVGSFCATASAPAVTPIVTVLGLDIGMLLGGVILIETVFNIPGVGRLAWDGIHQADLPIIQGRCSWGRSLS